MHLFILWFNNVSLIFINNIESSNLQRILLPQCNQRTVKLLPRIGSVCQFRTLEIIQNKLHLLIKILKTFWIFISGTRDNYFSIVNSLSWCFALFYTGVHVSRLSSLDVIFEQEREFISSTIDNDYDSAIEIHREEKRSLLNTIQSVKTHYHDSYNMQRNYFQAIKDDIINQVINQRLIRLIISNHPSYFHLK